MSDLKVGDSAPEFELQDTSGCTVRLHDLRGKMVVIYFYPRDDTPGCTKEACGFRDNLADFTDAGALIYGVSADSVQAHQKFSDKFSLNFPLLADTDKTMVRDYGVWVEKKQAGRTYMGIQRATFLIDGDGKISHIWPNVRPDEHAAEVLVALQG